MNSKQIAVAATIGALSVAVGLLIGQLRPVQAQAPAASGASAQPFAVVATDFEGADIGAKINAASKAYPQGVQIQVPAGTYPFATSIRLKPSDALVGVHFGDADHVSGTTLEYTGDGIAIDLTGSRELRPVVTLRDFRLRNTGKGKYGVYATWATRYFAARSIIIDGFDTGLYLGDCIINDFTSLHIYNCKVGIDIKTGYTIQFYSCKIDGGNPGVRVNYGNLITLFGCTFESQKGGHSVVFQNGGTGNSMINCYFEDNGPKADVHISSDNPGEAAVRLVSVEGCTFGSKGYCIELDGHIQAATIFRNYFGTSGAQRKALKISSPDVQRLSIGANIFYDSAAMLPGAPPPDARSESAKLTAALRDQPYIENPHQVEIYPIGYLPSADRTDH